MELTVLQDTGLEKSFTKYGGKFQLSILSLFIQDKTFARKINSILRPEYFDNKYTQFVCELILEYYSGHYLAPDFDILKTLIETKVQVPKLYLVTLENIQTADLSHRTYIEEEVEKFCFVRHALEKIEEEKNNIMLGKFDKAREVAFTKYKPLSTESKEYDLKEDYAKILEEQINNPVPLPLESINKVTKGGPGAGNLCIVMAQSNFGKSNFLVALTRHCAVKNLKALYVSLETDGIQLIQRACAGLVLTPQEQISYHPELLKEKVSQLPGNIKFVEFKATTARVESIKMKVDEFKALGFFPDLLIVDGLNQLKTPKGSSFSNSNDKFEYLAEELRDYAKEEGIPTWAAFQSNRGGFNTEIADEQNIGKAIEVYQVCDFMLMFTQSLPQQETGECYVQVLKNRLGPKGLTLKLKYDPNQVTFVELESVQRSMLHDQNKRKDVQKGVKALEDTLQKYKKKT